MEWRLSLNCETFIWVNLTISFPHFLFTMSCCNGYRIEDTRQKLTKRGKKAAFERNDMYQCYVKNYGNNIALSAVFLAQILREHFNIFQEASYFWRAWVTTHSKNTKQHIFDCMKKCYVVLINFQFVYKVSTFYIRLTDFHTKYLMGLIV